MILNLTNMKINNIRVVVTIGNWDIIPHSVNLKWIRSLIRTLVKLDIWYRKRFPLKEKPFHSEFEGFKKIWGK